MDDIGIWNRRLNAQEVLDLYLNTNVSVAEIEGEHASAVFDAATGDLVLRVPNKWIGTTFSILDASGRLLENGTVLSDLTRIAVRDGSGLCLVRCNALPADVIRVVIP